MCYDFRVNSDDANAWGRLLKISYFIVLHAPLHFIYIALLCYFKTLKQNVFEL
jgi:hypothetical protein